MGLGPPAEPAGGVRAEVLDDHLCLLRHGGVVRERVPGEQRVRLGGVHLALVRVLVHQLPVGVVRNVVAEGIEDEALLDGLAHRVGVEGDVRGGAVDGLQRTEEFEGLGLGGGGEREVGEVRSLAALQGLADELGVGGGRGRLLGCPGLVGVRVQAQFAQGRAYGGGRVAGLRGVRFVHDDREVAALELGGVAAQVVDEGREGVQRDRDDLPGLAGEGFRQLVGLRTVLVVDLHDQTGVLLETADRLAELGVEVAAVGDDDDLVEDGCAGLESGGQGVWVDGCWVGGRVQGGQAVCQPADGVGLAGAGGGHPEVVVTGAVAGRVRGELGDDVPLVVAREDQLLARPAVRALLLAQVHEPLDQVQPGVWLPDLLPQVRGRVRAGGGGRWIPRASGLTGAFRPGVERQEPRRLAAQFGRDEHQVGIDGEVGDHAAREDQFGGVPVGAVLLLGVLHALAGEGVLQLGGGERDAVEEEGEVEAVALVCLLRRVLQLPDDSEAVRPVVVQDRLGGDEGRLEVREPDPHAVVLHPLPEHIQHAIGRDRLIHAFGEPGLSGVGIPAIEVDQLVPVVGLSLADELEELGGIQAEVRLVVAVVAERPAGGEERGDDRVAEHGLMVYRAHGYLSPRFLVRWRWTRRSDR
jgi:hypothetical protein